MSPEIIVNRKDNLMNLSSEFRTVKLLGIDIFAMRMEEILSLCEKTIDNKSKLLLGVVNVAKIVKSKNDEQLRNSLNEVDVVLADGQGIVWLSKLIGKPLPERVAGIDIMYRLLECASKKKYGVYFLGAKSEVVKKVVDIVKVDYPGASVAGYRDGYFDESEEKDVAEEIKKSSADIIFVAIPTPIKENFLGKWRDYINVPVCHGVGGSFDIVAGVTKRAPLWMQNWGLEWFYRLVQEPRRMWRRYLVTNSIFVFLSISEIARVRLKNLTSKLNWKNP